MAKSFSWQVNRSAKNIFLPLLLLPTTEQRRPVRYASMYASRCGKHCNEESLGADEPLLKGCRTRQNSLEKSVHVTLTALTGNCSPSLSSSSGSPGGKTLNLNNFIDQFPCFHPHSTLMPSDQIRFRGFTLARFLSGHHGAEKLLPP